VSVVDEEHISTDERRIFNGRSSLRMEECAKSMGQRSNYAAMKKVPRRRRRGVWIEKSAV
jgi:hypothetical protein